MKGNKLGVFELYRHTCRISWGLNKDRENHQKKWQSKDEITEFEFKKNLYQNCLVKTDLLEAGLSHPGFEAHFTVT